MNFKNASLRIKIIFITVFISFISTVVMTGINSFKDYQRVSQSFDQRMKLETHILSDNIGSALIFRDSENMQITIDSFYADKSIIYVEVYDELDELFFKSSSNNMVGDEESIKSTSMAIMVDNDIVGRVVIAANNHELDLVVRGIIQAMFLNLSISVVLVFFLAFIFQRLISRPILSLYQISETVAKTQDYSLRVTPSSNDEVGKLSYMFNEMLEKVEKRDEKLEKLVEQRTFELEKLADEFRHRAFHDSLTGLPNRALLSERFDLAVEHATRNKNKFGCLLLDLDNFKMINDTKGHNYGDQLLIEVASRLKETIRKEDLVCRLGGDEFVILLIDLEAEEGLKVVLDKVLATIGKDYYLNNELVKTGVSIGAALYPEHGRDLNSIKRKADVAMYRAKDAGKNCYFIYTQDMQEDVKHRLMIQNDLEKALHDEEIVLYFQPKVHLQKECVTGFEVLIRWHHPKEGFLTPIHFIPYAEESQQIIEIDYYVLRKAFETLQRWRQKENYDYSLAINLSGRHFTDFKVVSYIQELLQTYDVDPASVEIEITEAVLIDDPDVAQRVVTATKALGIQLSLDDFGTGYSSLDYLRTLPIDCIKLDQTFIREIDVNMQERRLIKGILSLGKGLDLELVAEGVETKEQLEILYEMECDYVQGYYFCKPVPEEQLVEWLESFTFNTPMLISSNALPPGVDAGKQH